MRAIDIIRKKRDGTPLQFNEIKFLIDSYTAGNIPDYQFSAFLMATYFNKMNDEETFSLTKCMLESGVVLDLKDIPGFKVDKHSTGGVGDKTSLIIAPIVAAVGLTVPMISGRGLGHSGGTLDKLESIPGFNINLSLDEFKKTLKKINISMIGQTQEIAPADKKIYALRDVTATVECIPLIVASIMSKKLAEGIDGLVLDIKVGNGAFMKNEKEARALTKKMIVIGKKFNKKITALLTDMNQPLGNAIGNSLEVIECIKILQGSKEPKDLYDLSVELSAQMILMSGIVKNIKSARTLVYDVLENKKALLKFKELIENHHGNAEIVSNLDLMPRSKYSYDFTSPVQGFVRSMDTEKLGIAACVLGAGREKMDSIIDPSCGFIMNKKCGDKVSKNEILLTIYYNSKEKLEFACDLLKEVFRYSNTKVAPSKLIKEIFHA